MKSLIALCLILGVVSAGFAAPEQDYGQLVLAREHSFLNDSRNLIENLVGNLRKAAQEAITAVGNFNAGVREETNHIRQKMADDIEKLRQRVSDAVDNVWDKMQNTSAGVRACVDTRRRQAASIFNDTAKNTLTCVDEHVSNVGGQIKGLWKSASDALAYSNIVLDDMHKCTTENTNLFSAGGCLGRVVVQVESKSLVFTTQTALTIARINLAVATLPASMEVCAGTNLVRAGIATGKIVMEIGGCSVSSIYSSIVGGTPQNVPVTDTTNSPPSITETDFEPVSPLTPVLDV